MGTFLKNTWWLGNTKIYETSKKNDKQTRRTLLTYLTINVEIIYLLTFIKGNYNILKNTVYIVIFGRSLGTRIVNLKH